MAHARRLGDRDDPPLETDRIDHVVEGLAGQPTGEVDCDRLAAELADHARHIDAAAPRIVALVRGPDFLDRTNLVRLTRGIDGRIQGQRDDRLHPAQLQISARCQPRKPRAAR
jgi:hypothetical protein